MEYNKYEGTMYSHCDCALTDIMKATDSLVKNLEYIFENIDRTILNSFHSLLNDIENEIVTKCSTPKVKLLRMESDSSESLFKNIIIHVKTVFHEIYTSWISGVKGYTPVYAECMNGISRRINDEVVFQRVLMKRESTWRGRK